MKKEKTINKDALLYGAAGLLLGIMFTWLAVGSTVRAGHHQMMKRMDMHAKTGNYSQMQGSSMSMSMSDMTGMLKDKTGDDFDKTFIEQMIVHHQGAIDMANLAKQNAKHDEVKKLADDILSAQSKEIDMMQTWQGDWGYKVAPQSHMMN
jgi:uncharacterized protein (DUF305 family)